MRSNGEVDLNTVRGIRVARTRDDLRFAEGEAPLGGGTWLYSEPQPGLTGLVDLTGLGWAPWERRPDGGLSVAGTCTVAQLVAIPADEGWRAVALFRPCAESLLQSFKIWGSATVGGNIATALAAGALIGLGAALDGELVIWTPGGGERRERVADAVVAERTTTLRAGEVIRSMELGPGPMAARTAFRRIALSPLGRAGTAVAGRRQDGGAFVLCVTGGTTRPEVVRWPRPPAAGALADAVGAIGSWFTDAHGAADWRRAVSMRLAEEIREELA